MAIPPQQLCTAVQKHAEGNSSIGRAWLIGGHAAGDVNADCDWDVAIELLLDTQPAKNWFFANREGLANAIGQDAGVQLDLHLYHSAVAPDIVSSVREHGVLIFFPWSALVHEAAHLVIGHVQGNHENGIVFAVDCLKPTDMAGASGMPESPEIAIRRSLAGVIASSIICPKVFPDHLLSAFAQSVVLTKAHPHFDQFSPADLQWWGGAYSDLEIAWQNAYKICGKNLDAAYGCLLAAEKDVRSLVEQYQDTICVVAKDIRSWLATEDPAENAMMLYPGARAIAKIPQ